MVDDDDGPEPRRLSAATASSLSESSSDASGMYTSGDEDTARRREYCFEDEGVFVFLMTLLGGSLSEGIVDVSR